MCLWLTPGCLGVEPTRGLWEYSCLEKNTPTLLLQPHHTASHPEGVRVSPAQRTLSSLPGHTLEAALTKPRVRMGHPSRCSVQIGAPMTAPSRGTPSDLQGPLLASPSHRSAGRGGPLRNYGPLSSASLASPARWPQSCSGQWGLSLPQAGGPSSGLGASPPPTLPRPTPASGAFRD